MADLSPEERAKALQETCGGDEELRSGVESLLESHDSLGGAEAGAPLLAPGDVVSERFRVICAVGSGGMGEVYKCEDIALGQAVALKALRPNAAGSDAAERFKREIQIARSVAHKNVCRVYEYGRHTTESASIDFFIMEFVEGETLRDYMDRVGPLSPEQARPLVQQIAAGLEALHDCGVVHRDLKPGNILLEKRADGRIRVVLTDFGIAGPIGERDAFASFATVSGQVMGTPLYMAPEQLTGLAAGPSTDLFSFGVVLYEMLTGQRPFPDQNRRTDRPKPPSFHNPEVTAEWDRLVLDCLQLDISKRPNAVDAVFNVIGGPTRSVDPSNAQTVALNVQRPAEPRSSRLVPALLSALAVVLAALGWSYLGTGPAESQGARRVAVLPIALAAGGPDLQALANGLTDTITGRLSQYESRNEELLVVPAAEVRKVGVGRADKARGALGVNYVIEGRMSTQDDRIRLTLTLIDAERMVQQETTVINGLRSKALDLEDEAVIRLANLLDLQALPSQLDSVAAVEPGAQEFYLQGVGYLQRSDDLESVNAAIQLFEKAIALDAANAKAYAGLSQAYLYKRDRTSDSAWVAKAGDASRKAVTLRPDSIEAQIARGQALAALGEPEEATEFFESALKLNPRSAEAYAGLGKAYEGLAGRAESTEEAERGRQAAESAYRKAISLRPNDWVSYKRLGLFYAKQNRYEDAIRQYEIIAELAPDNAHAFSNLASFSHFTGDDEAAKKYLEKTLELDPRRVGALTNLALLRSRSGDAAGAAELYERSIQENDKNHLAWGSLGSVYRRLDRHEEADKAYRKAISLLEERMAVEGESLEIHSYLAHHYAGLGDFKQSQRHVAAALRSPNGDDQVNIAIAQSLAGDLEGAAASLRRALNVGYRISDLRGIKALEPVLSSVVDQEGDTE